MNKIPVKIGIISLARNKEQKGKHDNIFKINTKLHGAFADRCYGAFNFRKLLQTLVYCNISTNTLCTVIIIKMSIIFFLSFSSSYFPPINQPRLMCMYVTLMNG